MELVVVVATAAAEVDTTVETTTAATSMDIGGDAEGSDCVDGGTNVVGVLVDVVHVLLVLVLETFAIEPPSSSDCGWLNGK